jgi:hypothetical protein
MDRDRELADDYTKMANLVERFEKRQALVVEGEWYLCEQADYPSFVSSSEWFRVEIGGYTVEDMQKMGWTVTPVTIFRKT